MIDIGNQLPQPDPRGWLAFDYLADDLQRAEDSTAAADYDRSEYRTRFTRPASPTERTLLTHLGHVVPDELDTHVRFDTVVRNRRWPTLEGED